MLLKTPIIILTFALSVFTGNIANTSSAQDAPVGVSQQMVREATTAKGLSLIEEITVEARALRLPENRAFVQAATADLLWAYDEKSARSLFSEAVSNLGDITNGVAQDDPEITNLEQVVEELRREVLLKVARHDQLWAREVARVTSRSPWQADDELPLNLSQAAQTMVAPRQSLPTVVDDQNAGSVLSAKSRTTEDSNANATAVSPERRDSFYSEAAASAQSEGDFNRARQLAKRITDPSARAVLLAVINRRSLLEAARSGMVQQTLTSLGLLHTHEERASMLVELAVAVAGNNGAEQARELLNQARNLLGNRPHNPAQLHAQLRVACAFARLDPDQGFEMIDLIARQLDEMAMATLVVDGFVTEEQYTRNDELMLKQVMQFLDLFPDESAKDNDLATLARAEFDRMKKVTDKFQRAEIRILAHLSLAECVLAHLSGGN